MKILLAIILLFLSAGPVRAEKASWYSEDYCRKYSPRCVTANGERFNDELPTAACDRRWRLGVFLKVSYQDRSIVVKCNDRGGFKKYGRVLDLSRSAFASLAPLSRGVIDVTIQEK